MVKNKEEIIEEEPSAIFVRKVPVIMQNENGDVVYEDTEIINPTEEPSNDYTEEPVKEEPIEE